MSWLGANLLCDKHRVCVSSTNKLRVHLSPSRANLEPERDHEENDMSLLIQEECNRN